jgi:hypothetical protein
MKRVFLAAVAAVAVVGCGRSADEKKAEEGVKAAQEAGEAARQAGQAARESGDAARQAGQSAESAQGTPPAAPGAPSAPGAPRPPGDLQALSQGLQALAGGGAAGSGVKVEPVRFQDLISHLPQVSGWEMQKPQGQRMTSPFPTASAEATYRSGGSRVEVEIVDTANNQMLLAPISMFLNAGYSQESTNGYEKAMAVNGQPGWEKWNITAKRGEVNALVGKRFIVTVKGNNVDDTKVLQDFAGKIDFAGLASLK